MKSFKKVTAVVLSAAMIFGSSLTAFAADTDGSTSSAAGTGQILDFKKQIQVVPTSLKVAINPNGYKVNLRYNKVTGDFDAGAKYYTESDGTYSVATDVTSDNFSTKKAAGLYTADTSQSQIVTFNYGLANKSTVARKITVKLDVTADSSVDFVTTEAAATAKTTGGTGTAEVGDYKIFMQLWPAKVGTTPSTNTYEKATAFDAQATYYTRSEAGVYTEATVANAEAFAAGAGTTNADVAFSLPNATYTLKDDAFIDFSTTAADIAEKYEMTGIGGYTGFTITGTMNTNTEWSQLETKTITITPTYVIADASGQETVVETGLYQVEADARNNTVTYNANYTGADPATATETFALDGHPTGVSDAITALKTREGYTFEGWFDAAADGNEVTITELSASATVYAHWAEIQNTAPSIETTEYTMAANTAIEIAVDLGSGSKVATEVSSVVWSETELLGTDFASYANGKVTIPASAVNNLMSISGDQALTIKFNDTDETTVQVTLKH
jgi:uncharacterized repeat protein (TIGR02543 family)